MCEYNYQWFCYGDVNLWGISNHQSYVQRKVSLKHKSCDKARKRWVVAERWQEWELKEEFGVHQEGTAARLDFQSQGKTLINSLEEATTATNHLLWCETTPQAILVFPGKQRGFLSNDDLSGLFPECCETPKVTISFAKKALSHDTIPPKASHCSHLAATGWDHLLDQFPNLW